MWVILIGSVAFAAMAFRVFGKRSQAARTDAPSTDSDPDAPETTEEPVDELLSEADESAGRSTNPAEDEDEGSEEDEEPDDPDPPPKPPKIDESAVYVNVDAKRAQRRRARVPVLK